MTRLIVLGFYLFFAFIYAPSGLVDIYDVPHFIKTLQYDVRIVMSIPKITAEGNTTNIRVQKVSIFKAR
jgi:uncharacterized protein YpmS